MIIIPHWASGSGPSASCPGVWLPTPPWLQGKQVARDATGEIHGRGAADPAGILSGECLDEIAALFALIRRERVGGAFWAPAPDADETIEHILRLPAEERAAHGVWTALRDTLPLDRTLVLPPGSAVPAWLAREAGEGGSRILTRGFDAHRVLGPHVTLWCAEPDALTECLAVLTLAYGGVVQRVGERREELGAAWAYERVRFGTRYVSPLTGQPWSAEEAIRYLGMVRRQMEENRRIAVCTGVAWWKRRKIAAFLAGSAPPVFRRTARAAIRTAEARGGDIAVWSSRLSPALRQCATRRGIGLRLMEDGFIRSAGLGSDLLPPSSIVIDSRGIYFDPTRESDLEHLLATAAFDPELLERARALRQVLVSRGVTKYAAGAGGAATALPDDGRRVILVPGQVADDLSVRLGAPEIGGNPGLLMRVREENPDALIVYRPHPDVDAGHRAGAIPDEDALRLADVISRDGPITAWISRCDELHTMTSLAGFEALLRGKKVVTYGRPFYSGWGLTEDRSTPCVRRNRERSLDELVAATLFLYPRYLDPLTALPCTPELLIERLNDARLWQPNLTMRVRRLQGGLRRWITRRLARRRVFAQKGA
ncbi:capsular polysaccharide export protein [Acidomonas methanolica]|nr:capsular polysaccharide export protein [Acidomonas methanolica]